MCGGFLRNRLPLGKSPAMSTHTVKSKYDRTMFVPVRSKSAKKAHRTYARSSRSNNLIRDSLVECDDIITETSSKRTSLPHERGIMLMVENVVAGRAAARARLVARHEEEALALVV